MKKTVHTFFFSILVLVYISANIGVCVYYHYCGGELEKVSAIMKTKSCCGSTDGDDGCCRNESKYMALKLDFNMAAGAQPDFSTPFTSSFHTLPFTSSLYHRHVSPVSPPDAKQFPPGGIALEIVRCSVFRI